MATRKAPAAKKRAPARERSVKHKRGSVRDRDEPRFVGKHLFEKGRVSSKGWVVIPKAIRDEMGLRPGDEVQFMLEPPFPNMKQDRGLYSLHMVRVPENVVELLSGMFPPQPGQPSWTKNLLEDRRREFEREEEEIENDRRRRRWKPA